MALEEKGLDLDGRSIEVDPLSRKGPTGKRSKVLFTFYGKEFEI